ncbi:MAG: MBL fold metallo-hydrolase [Actinomycetota bacterium]|nr:MBL fold metallo-hydrolase [Actinomycetota bacterium]
MSLRLSVLASGSSGNATYMETDEGGLLVDAGLSCRRIAVLLARIGRRLGDVDAVLLTHGHSDHTSGVRSLVRERGMPIYSAPDVGGRLGTITVEAGETLRIGGLMAEFFEVPHDSRTYGVCVSDDERTAIIATDLGEISVDVLRRMRGAEAVVLEANHELEWLRRGPYPTDLKRRVASANGHLSNRQTAEAACDLAPHGLKDLVLAHLSKTNNSPARATGTVTSALREAGHGRIRVRAALASHPTPWVDVGELLESPEYAYRYGKGEVQKLFETE